MRRDRPLRRRQAPRAIMIVQRMQRLDVDDRRPPRAILVRQHRHAPARLVPIGDRPPPPVRLDRHPLGPHREQLPRPPRVIGQVLHITTSTPQQLGAHPPNPPPPPPPPPHLPPN